MMMEWTPPSTWGRVEQPAVSETSFRAERGVVEGVATVKLPGLSTDRRTAAVQ